MATTSIEWADAVLNAATGCTEVSAGCDHCYARVQAGRLRAMGQAKYANGFAYTEHLHVLGQVASWRTPRRVFVNSMSDFFHEEATWLFVAAALDTFCAGPQHVFQILTKRPGKMRSWTAKYCDQRGLDDLPPHLWLGVSAEDQPAADLRIPSLVETRCQTRFLSCEPLLGPIELGPWLEPVVLGSGVLPPAVDWVITGGESGPHARPMDPDWARSIRDQCLDAGVAFFFKQHGGVHHSAGGRLLDGREWNEFPSPPPH